MSAAAYSLFAVLLGAGIVPLLRERSLYVLFFAAYTQNFVLAWLYTAGWAGKEFCRGMLMFKEAILLALFAYAAAFLHRRYRGRWPRPLYILFFFAGYCAARFAFGALFLNDATLDGLRKVRMAVYPLQILTVAAAVAWERPEFARRFVRHAIYGVTALAAAAIVMFLFARVDFWKQHADLAGFNLDVKGDNPISVDVDQGVPITGIGRDAFLFLSSFRAMGTFGDPFTLAFATLMPVLLLHLCYPPNWRTHLLLAISAAALFFTFSRSAWIFLALTMVYYWFHRGNYKFIVALAAAAAIALVAWPPLAEFAASDVSSLSWNNPGGAHAEGLVYFYQKDFTDPGDIFGKGMDDSVQRILESGYAFLLEHFGLPAYAAFVWFCISLFEHLRSGPLGDKPLNRIVQAVPLCMLVVLHFSSYPFAFSEYLFIWFVVGMCLRPADRMERHAGELAQRAA